MKLLNSPLDFDTAFHVVAERLFDAYQGSRKALTFADLPRHFSIQIAP